MAIELYPHQLKALGEIHNGSILKGGVGTGKSITAIAYYFTKVCGGAFKVNGKGELKPFTTPKDIYVVTTAKKRDSKDWEKEAAPFSVGRERAASMGNVKLTVVSWNDIINYTEIKDAFFVFDEQRLVGSGAWVKAFIKISKANEWILLSATPGDNWMDYVPVFVANGYYKNRTEFIRLHVVFSNYSKFPKIDHYVEIGKLERLRRLIIVDMPYIRKTIRHVENIIVEFDKEKFQRVFKDRWHIYEDRPIRDVGELFIVMRKLVNSDPSRIGAVLQLMEKHPRLIIFYNFNYELEALRVLGNVTGIPLAEWNGHKHQEIPETDKWLYLVQYTAGAEGWNCVSTDSIVFYSLNYSYKLNEQGKGRIDRLNTKYVDLHYYVLRSGAMIDTAINKSLTTKKSFNEKDFISKLS